MENNGRGIRRRKATVRGRAERNEVRDGADEERVMGAVTKAMMEKVAGWLERKDSSKGALTVAGSAGDCKWRGERSNEAQRQKVKMKARRTCRGGEGEGEAEERNYCSWVQVCAQQGLYFDTPDGTPLLEDEWWAWKRHESGPVPQ